MSIPSVDVCFIAIDLKSKSKFLNLLHASHVEPFHLYFKAMYLLEVKIHPGHILTQCKLQHLFHHKEEPLHILHCTSVALLIQVKQFGLEDDKISTQDKGSTVVQLFIPDHGY